MNPSFVSSAWIRGAPQPSCTICRMSRRISAARRGRPGLRVLEMRVQYRRNRARFHPATVPALTMTRRLAHAGHDSRSATQKARSTSSSGGRGRSFFSAVTCCRRARFSITRSARRRHIARNARAPRVTRKMRARSMAVEFDLLRPGTQEVREGRKSLISRQHEF